MKKADFIRWNKLSMGLAKSNAHKVYAFEAKTVEQAVARYFKEIQDIKFELVSGWYNEPHRLFRRTQLFLRDSKVTCESRDARGDEIHLSQIGTAVFHAIITGFAVAIAPVKPDDMPATPYRVVDIQNIFGKAIPDYVRNFFRGTVFHIPYDQRSLPVTLDNARRYDEALKGRPEPTDDKIDLSFMRRVSADF